MSDFIDRHWLLFKHGQGVVGCHCGFVGPKSDEGWGRSVVEHIAAEAIRGATLAWTDHAPTDGVAFNRAEVADVLFRYADSLDGGPAMPCSLCGDTTCDGSALCC